MPATPPERAYGKMKGGSGAGVPAGRGRSGSLSREACPSVLRPLGLGARPPQCRARAAARVARATPSKQRGARHHAAPGLPTWCRDCRKFGRCAAASGAGPGALGRHLSAWRASSWGQQWLPQADRRCSISISIRRADRSLRGRALCRCSRASQPRSPPGPRPLPAPGRSAAALARHPGAPPWPRPMAPPPPPPPLPPARQRPPPRPTSRSACAPPTRPAAWPPSAW